MIEDEPTERINVDEPTAVGVDVIVSTALALVTAAVPISGPIAVEGPLARAEPTRRDAPPDRACRNACVAGGSVTADG
jgi:hypothetical protein